MAVGSQLATTNILADLNLVVRHGIAIRIYAIRNFGKILIWQLLKQTTKPNSSWYTNNAVDTHMHHLRCTGDVVKKDKK